MNISLITILLTPFMGGILAYLGGKINKTVKYIFAISFSALFIIELFIYENLKIDFLILTSSYGSLQIFQINPLSWFFSLILGIITLISIVLSMNERQLLPNIHIMTVMFLESAVFGLFLSGDALTFFIFLCIILLLTYILLIEISHAFSLKFLNIQFAGMFLFLILILVLFKNVNSFTFVNIKSIIPEIPDKIILFTLIIFTVWIFIMTTLFPFNLWISSLYSKISASSKLLLLNVIKNGGLYALILFFYGLIGLKMQSVYTLKIIGIFGALTFVSSSLLALFNTDKEQIVTHLFFAETGISLIGLSLMNSYGFTSALLIMINQLLWMGLFLFTIKRIKFMDKLHMDIIGFFISILMIMSIPFTIQFASRYMLFTTLLGKGNLFYVSFIVSGNALEMITLYKLAKIKIFEKAYAIEVEWLNSKVSFISILIMSAILIIPGLYPRILLSLIEKIDQTLNPYSIKIQFSNLQSINTVQSKIILISTFSGVFLGFVAFTLIPCLKKKLPVKIILPISSAFSKLDIQAKLSIRKFSASVSRIKAISDFINSSFNSFRNNLPLIQDKIKIIILYFVAALALISVALLILLKI
jgi:formate hydrogenlyase subunit 3/multisubunit Na+/H+ antiporter MnhD subunit